MLSINSVKNHLPSIENSSINLKVKHLFKVLNQKIEQIWTRFCALLQNYFSSPTQKHIQLEIDKVDLLQNEPKPAISAALRSAFVNSLIAIKTAGLNPQKLPKPIAFQLTEIVARFGVSIYASKDVETPFQASLDVLKAAFLLQEYALGLSSTCPNLSNLMTIDDLYNEEVTKIIAQQADEAIDALRVDRWSSKALMISEKQLLLIPQILRYINGAERYLENTNLSRSQRLLETAEACLSSAQKRSSFNQSEVNHQIAELLYNDVSGFLAAKINEFEFFGETPYVEEAKQRLSLLWNRCVELSKDPEMMSARCDNKRTFIEKLSPEQEVELRTNSLNKHLALPKERQNCILLALVHHNLSHAYEKMNEIPNAAKHAIEALKYVIEAKGKGENNIQFDSVIDHAKALSLS